MAIDKDWREHSKKHGKSANFFLAAAFILLFVIGTYFLVSDVFIESRLSKALYRPLKVEITQEKKLNRSFYEVYFKYKGKDYRLFHKMGSGGGVEYLDGEVERKTAHVYADPRRPERAMTPNGDFFNMVWYGGLILMLSYFAGVFLSGKIWPLPEAYWERDPKAPRPPEPLPEGRTAGSMMAKSLAYGLGAAAAFFAVFFACAYGLGVVVGLAVVFACISLLTGIFGAIQVRSRLKGTQK